MRGYYRKEDSVVLYVIEGGIDAYGEIVDSGNVVVWKPNELISFVTLCKTKILSIRLPGTDVG